ncbi:hypothetical protein HNR33_002716 [Brassicibacter mesophilus]
MIICDTERCENDFSLANSSDTAFELMSVECAPFNFLKKKFR